MQALILLLPRCVLSLAPACMLYLALMCMQYALLNTISPAGRSSYCACITVCSLLPCMQHTCIPYSVLILVFLFVIAHCLALVCIYICVCALVQWKCAKMFTYTSPNCINTIAFCVLACMQFHGDISNALLCSTVEQVVLHNIVHTPSSSVPFF